MPEPSAHSPLPDAPRHGWIPHPLWLLAVAVVLLGAAIACTVYFHPTARLIREIKALDGSVDARYDGPHWLENLIDKERLTVFHRIRGIAVYGPAGAGQWLQSVTGHGESLGRRGVTDEWLVRLSGINSLDTLELTDNPIRDAGIAHLQDLPNLGYLNLNRTKVGDKTVKDLNRFPQLEYLLLDETRVTDAGLVYLRGSSRLRLLSLGSTVVTDAGLENLEDLTDLAYLNLSGTLVTDAGMVKLLRFTKLKHLSLGATAVTDAGLQQLKSLSSLSSLEIAGTPVTAAGIADLKTALPKLDAQQRLKGIWRSSTTSESPFSSGTAMRGKRCSSEKA